MIIIARRTWGLRDYLKAAEAKGRRIGKPHGSYIDDLAALKKAIVLCDGCVRRFNHVKHGYYRQREFPFVRGSCDACKQHSERASLFIHEMHVKNCWTTREEMARLRRR